jgi:Na+-transporting methylmalonyl-CoA/oxaloacetate decarboxylase gamma subunit
MFLLQAQQVLTDTLSKAGKSEFFKQVDPIGLGMTVIGYVIVFIALLLLYLVFYNISKVLQLKLRRFLRKEGVIDKEKKDVTISGEVNAAIAMALHLYFQEMHDQESAILTISRASKIYSPWNSKIYGLRQHPR